jgi:hypothetical protein
MGNDVKIPQLEGTVQLRVNIMAKRVCHFKNGQLSRASCSKHKREIFIA